MKTIIGLTGPTGAGKSIASESVKNTAFVINCDTVARDTVKKDSDGLKALVKVFGKDILQTDGTLNRSLLAKRAFVSAEKTELLNAALFPFITKEIYKIIKNAESDIILLDAPTLFESGLDSICHAVIAVLCNKETRKSRIIARDTLSEENALIRINAGHDNAFYTENADAVVYNEGDMDLFIADFISTFNKLTEELK